MHPNTSATRSTLVDNVDGGNSKTTTAAAEWVHHETLYFEDGNVVFLCENTLFCFYRGLLSRTSQVFSGMFSLPRLCQPPNTETYRNLPLIKLSDTATEFGHLLNSLIEPDYIPAQGAGPINFEAGLSLVRLCGKYIVTSPFVKRIIARFDKFIPVYYNPVHFQNAYEKDFDLGFFGRHLEAQDYMAMIQTFKERDMNYYLPWLYYRTIFFWDMKKLLFDADTIPNGSSEEIKVLTYGTHVLTTRSLTAISRIYSLSSPIDVTCRRTYCRASASALRFQYLGTLASSLNGRQPLLEFLTNGPPDATEDVCSVCKQVQDKAIYEEKQKLWKDLPDVFLLPGSSTSRDISVLLDSEDR